MNDFSKSKVPILFELLETRGISQKQLAAAVQVSTGNISDWKSGKSAPSGEVVIRISKYLNVTPNDIYGVESGVITSATPLSPEQQELLDMYNALDQEQKALVEGMLKQMLGKA